MAHPKKSLGQHFLRNSGAAARIVAAVEPREDEVVVEIGPGEGVLTGKLAELGRPLIAIELDDHLAEKLRERFGSRIEVRHEDAVRAALPDVPYRAVGNLPYNVGTPILRRVIADPNCRRAVFMLQKEVAERLVAKPRGEHYGYLTLYREIFSDARIVMTLEPRSFYPPPRVRSAVVVLDPRPPAFSCDREKLLSLVSAAFRMRRKKLVNNLTDWDRERVLRALAAARIGDGVRAEEMSLADFDNLCGALEKEPP
jgi:16S rRNA (adenine1518-N6/adenine1519-N6)-dimethyltransferase